ncbi:hypothetical protein EBU71_19720, partial [bacterium]|nr:hypothetical protein [Candidatus Elulimicrobium humile]
EVDSIHNFYIKYTNQVGPADQYTNNLTNNGIKKGQIIFTVDWTTPTRLFYTSNDEQLSTGEIIIKEPQENSTINVESEILGKLQYTSKNNIKFINGLKIRFGGIVFPEYYRDADFIVEGVGESIKLVKFSLLSTPDVIADLVNDKFDGTNFDQFPFDNFKNIPLVPEYITINKASKDLNPWTRYNRWFHSDVIKASAEFNNAIPEYPQEYRATRPIIEFKANLQLYKFGDTAIGNIDLIDNITTDAFGIAESADGYYIDNVKIEEGFRVIFNADTDPLVRGKVFRATYSKVYLKTISPVTGQLVISNTEYELKLNLELESDTPVDGSSILVTKGETDAGSSYFFDGEIWTKSQQRTYRNQPPLFELFDKDANSYGGKYYLTNFTGNQIFGYGVGTGTPDSVLGFPLQYKNVGVEGTYLFNNYFSNQDIIVVENNETKVVSSETAFFKINDDEVKFANIW